MPLWAEFFGNAGDGAWSSNTLIRVPGPSSGKNLKVVIICFISNCGGTIRDVN
jgi:hypothetical protein